jgi:hypothetical protein
MEVGQGPNEGCSAKEKKWDFFGKIILAWTLSIVLLFFIENNVSQTGLYLRPQARAYSVGPNRSR